MISTISQKVLWIGEPCLPPPNVRMALHGWDLRVAQRHESLARQLVDVPVVLVWSSAAINDSFMLDRLLGELEQAHAVAVFLLPADARHVRSEITKRRGAFVCVNQDAEHQELTAQLHAACALQPGIKALRQELGEARDMHQGKAKIIQELDEEMRLAARLQRDFLPRRLPEVGQVRFGVLYRPASWVSGDIYDIARLDEDNVGFYVADVVGHGLPAALLTMFIKKALQTKRIVGSQYQIIPPDVSLDQLNTDICDQNLSSCQFCTALYCILDCNRLVLTYARGGHPEPILVGPDGSTRHLSAKGGLLGIFPEEKYEPASVQLSPGDRIVLYTDGMEEALVDEQRPRGMPLEDMLGPLIRKSRDELLLNIAGRIEARYDDTHPDDDITMMVVDVER